MNRDAFPKSWRTQPPPIPESEIACEYSADVIVAGMGHAGTAATRAAAEAGASVIAFEKMRKEKYNTYGCQVANINSKFMASRGVPRVDPIELFNEWMLRSGNRANPKLIMQFCQKSGESFDWYMEPFTREQIDTMEIAFWPAGTKFSNDVYEQKFWTGTAHLDFSSTFTLREATLANLEIAQKHGAELHFGMDAQQLVMNGERVVGVIARDRNGKYVKYNAKKGVILATGGFGSNKEMCYDLLTDIVDILDEGEKIRMGGRDGKGIKMGVWAGGRLEPRPLATMGGNHATPMGVCGPYGTLWVDENGQRYCNEGFGDPVFAGFPEAYLKRGTYTIIFDSSILEDLEYSPPAHGSFWISNESRIKRLQEGMAGARTAGSEGFLARNPEPGGIVRLYAADTFEELADYIGFKGVIKQNFLNTVMRYNEFCATGRDEDFGKGAHLLNALDEPPYYAQPTSAGERIGGFLVTVGGLITDEYQNVLNQKKDPIPGLYAAGNCCGRRFGFQYSTPIAGVSIGIAITLGREVGRIVAEL